MKKFNRIFAILILSLFAAVVCVSALASGENRYVIDEYAGISQDNLSLLNSKAAALSEKYGMNTMFVVTANTPSGIGSYIESLYQSTFGQSDGIVIGHDVTASKWGARRIGRAAELFTEADEDELWEAYNSVGSYSGGIDALLNKAEGLYSERIGTDVPPVTEAPAGQTAEPAATALPAQQYGVRVVDLADLLSDSEEDTLRSKLDDISTRHNCDVVVVTVQNIGNKSAMEFADDFYDYNDYRPDGIMLLVSMGTRDWWVSTTGSGITAITDPALRKIEDDAVSRLTSGEYYSAFNKYADLCDDFLTQAENGKPYSPPAIGTGTAGVIAAGVGLLTGAIGTGSMKSKLKSVHQKTGASDYMRRDSLNIMRADEIYLFSNVTRTPIVREERGSGGGGGVHISSSGTSHGGGGGKF